MTSDAIISKAKKLAENGFAPLPLNGKAPVLKGWQEIEQITCEMIDEWAASGLFKNIGLRTGDNGLVVLDFDGKGGYEAFTKAFGELADTYTVETGGGDGMHVYYHVAGELPRSTGQLEVPGGYVEIKAKGRQIVVPPSIHPDTGALYEVFNKNTARKLKNMDAILSWIMSFNTLRYEPQQRELDIRQAEPMGGTAYSKAALTNMAGELASLTDVENDFQNTSLNLMAWKLAHFVGRGDLTEQEVRSALEGAMRTNGYIGRFGQKAFDKTFDSGFQRGMMDTQYVPKVYQNNGRTPHREMPGKRGYEPPKIVVEQSGVTMIGRTRIIKRTSLFDDLTKLIDDDDYVPEVPPIIFPLQCLHKLGGQARVTMPGKVIGFVGASGSGKTSALETLADAYVASGIPVWMWTPEWSPNEMAERVVQRYDGPTQDELYLHIIDKYRAKVLQQPSNPEHRLTDEQRTTAAFAMRHVRSWSTDVYFMENSLMTIDEMSEVVAAAKSIMTPFPRVLICDYAQLLKANEIDEKDETTMYNMIQRFKGMCVYYSLIGIMATQTTKEDARKNIKQGAFKGTTVFNCTKNSRGKKGRVRVKSDPERLRILDEPYPDQTFQGDDYYLGSQAGRYINDDAYNLWITLNPEYYDEV